MSLDQVLRLVHGGFPIGHKMVYDRIQIHFQLKLRN